MMNSYLLTSVPINSWHPCRFGNVLPPGQDVAALVAHGKGPGPVTATVSPSASGGADVAFVGRTAGPYLLSLVHAASGEALPGSPLQVLHLRFAMPLFGSLPTRGWQPQAHRVWSHACWQSVETALSLP